MSTDSFGSELVVIDQIRARLLDLPTEQLIVHSADIVKRTPPPPDDDSVRSNAMAGAYAWLAVRKYRTALDQVIGRHQVLRNQIQMDRSKLNDPGWTTAHADEASELRTKTWYEGGVQEVETHFFVTCIFTLKCMLSHVADVTGAAFPAADLKFLAEYVDLRNDFEHPIERFTGHINQQKLVQHVGTTIRIGPSVDAQGRYKVGSKSYDINVSALDRTTTIIDQMEERVRKVCIDQASTFIATNPTLFPDVESAIRGNVSRLSYYPEELTPREI